MKNLFKKIKTIFFKSVFFIYTIFIKAKSKNPESKRREFILNILLTAMLCLNLISFALSFTYFLFNPEQNYLNSLFIFIMCLLFASLLYLSRKGFYKSVTYIFLLLFFILITYNSLQWGADTPQLLLSYALLIIMTGILINTKFSFISAIIISFSSFLINYLQINNILTANSSWRSRLATTGDIIVYSGTLLIMAIISWLYNRELEKSLDKLEIMVEERTQELKEAQLQIMAGLYKSSEFGKLASGLMHDTINQLNALALNMEALKNLENKTQNKTFLKGALDSTKKLMKYSKAVHKQLHQQGQGKKEKFNINEEINDAIQILDYKAKRFNLEIKNLLITDFFLYGNTLKFNQIMTTLISNAIDAYEDYESNKKIIEISAKEENHNYIISVEDWGKGISEKNINKIFDQFFTTKEIYKGTGIGLANIKKIIENDFHGKIKVQSTKNFGTTFIIIIPIKQYELKTNS